MASQDAKSGPQAPRRTRIGGYEVVAKLGQGGMGAVFKATQLSIGRTVALKVLPPRLAKNNEFAARFFREARSAAKLDHPNIVQAIDAGEADGYHYFAMEFIEGESVEHMLKTRGALPEKQVLGIVRDIGRALAYAHEAGIIHRDIKPGNILVTPDGTAKLADLGLARETTSQATDLTQAGFAIGTPDYISPEQIRGETDLDGRSDIYSLGATLYHMLAGEPPFAGGSGNEVMAKHLADPIPNAHKVNPQVSMAAARIVWKAMPKTREKRYATAADMVQDIESALAGHETSAPMQIQGPSHRSVRAARRKRSGNKPLLFVVGGIAIAALVITLVIAMWPPPGPGPVPPIDPNPHAKPDNGNGKPAASDDAKLLSALREWAKLNPDDLPEAIRKYKVAVRRMTDAEVIAKANADLAALRKELARAAGEAFAEVVSSADKLARAGDYDGAIAACGKLPEQFRGILAGRADAKVAQLKEAVEAEVYAVLEAARAHSEAKEPEMGLARLNDAKDIKYEPLEAGIRRMRERLEKERDSVAASQDEQAVVAARARIRKLLDKIEAAAVRGALTEAGRLSDAALEDKTLDVVKKELDTVAEIGRILAEIDKREKMSVIEALRKRTGKRITLRTTKGDRAGKVKRVSADTVVLDKGFVIDGQVHERPDQEVPISELTEETLAKLKTPWTARTPAGHIATALLASARNDAKKMAAALKGAQGHPFHARYTARLEAVRAAQRENDAEAAWRALEPYAAKSLLHPSEITTLSKLLSSFEKDHGETRFAASQREAISRLRSLLVPVYTKWPFSPAEAKQRQRETAAALGLPVTKEIDLGGGVTLEMILIPAGEFVMSSPPGEAGRNSSREGSQHTVRITLPFYMGRYEVTQEQWRRLMTANPSRFKGAKNPVERISWHDCQEFISRLNELHKSGFRLPTEAEWEYACRAGTPTPFHFGETILTDQANYIGTIVYGAGKKGLDRKKTIPVGSFSPNAFGLCDMHGNVYDWCSDWHGPYDAKPQTDPRGPAAGSHRILRGGSWFSNPAYLRSAFRWNTTPTAKLDYCGLRVVLECAANK
ncbi:MAG: SUMF1/EgtB/PvdO family nonheme iron enzyme [Planctomycetota bacterium]